jgi:hypothetical protein
MKLPTRLLLAALATLPSVTAWACASCGCSINTDWGAQGLSSSAGWTLDLRYDALDQNKLWTGTHAISSTDAAQVVTPSGDPAEVEQYTNNHYLSAALDYSDGRAWGVGLVLPWISRSHSTLGVGSDGTVFDPANGAYTSSGSGLGDVRLMGRYFGFSEAHDIGIQLGLKLPTGSKNQFGSDGSTPVDPGLQRGTGTTDLILGAYRFGALSPEWRYFTQASYQAALNHSTMNGGSYRPGDSLNLSLGARYLGFSGLVPTLQLNLRHARTDSGDAADTFATGGTLAYLTLGALLPLSPQAQPYVNVQLPVYQNVHGIQLTPKAIYSLGMKLGF